MSGNSGEEEDDNDISITGEWYYFASAGIAVLLLLLILFSVTFVLLCVVLRRLRLVRCSASSYYNNISLSAVSLFAANSQDRFSNCGNRRKMKRCAVSQSCRCECILIYFSLIEGSESGTANNRQSHSEEQFPGTELANTGDYI